MSYTETPNDTGRVTLDIGGATAEQRNALLVCLVDGGWLLTRIWRNRYIVDPPGAWTRVSRKQTVSRWSGLRGAVDRMFRHSTDPWSV